MSYDSYSFNKNNSITYSMIDNKNLNEFNYTEQV